MAKLSVQERLERLREAGRKQSGQGGQQSPPLRLRHPGELRPE